MPRKGSRGASVPNTPAAPPATTPVEQAVSASASATEPAAAVAAVVVAPAAAPVAVPVAEHPAPVRLAETAEDLAALSGADRENPKKLAGAALRDLGYRMGLPRSEMGSWSDDKVRQQCEAITYRRFAEAAGA